MFLTLHSTYLHGVSRLRRETCQRIRFLIDINEIRLIVVHTQLPGSGIAHLRPLEFGAVGSDDGCLEVLGLTADGILHVEADDVLVSVSVATCAGRQANRVDIVVARLVNRHIIGTVEDTEIKRFQRTRVVFHDNSNIVHTVVLERLAKRDADPAAGTEVHRSAEYPVSIRNRQPAIRCEGCRTHLHHIYIHIPAGRTRGLSSIEPDALNHLRLAAQLGLGVDFLCQGIFVSVVYGNRFALVCRAGADDCFIRGLHSHLRAPGTDLGTANSPHLRRMLHAGGEAGQRVGIAVNVDKISRVAVKAYLPLLCRSVLRPAQRNTIGGKGLAGQHCRFVERRCVELAGT